MTNPSHSNVGRVYLVGAGPGAPELITLRGVECLRKADVILYDYLVNPLLLRHARPDALKTSLGKHRHERIWTQAEINAQLIKFGQEGKTVVRLKSGDPSVFGRGAEEGDALAQAGIPFEVVPGITAGLAASSYGGIPITHREFSSAVALVTGHEDADKTSSSLDFAALASFPGTLVFYMGVTTVDRWSSALLNAGKPASTPVGIIRRCSFPDQQVMTCTLGTVAKEYPKERLRPPVIFLVGEACTWQPTLGWFSRRPLFGQKIVVTRPEHQASSLADPLAEAGADVLLAPTITIGPADGTGPLDNAINNLKQYNWVVFASANGVHYFLKRLLERGFDLRQLGQSKLAAIGSGTAQALKEYHLHADLIPEEFRAESLAAALIPQVQAAPQKNVLLVRASRGREVLAEQLSAAGASVTQVVAYSSIDITTPDPAIAEKLAAGQIHWITVTSSAIAQSLVKLYGTALQQTKLASISPITSDTLRQLGYPPTVEATQYTMDGVVKAILDYAQPKS